MHLRRIDIAFAVPATGIGVSEAFLFTAGLISPGLLDAATTVSLVAWKAKALKRWQPSDPMGGPFGAPKPAKMPPDGHIRFTLVVEGRAPDRIAEAWSDLCRPDREVSEELRLLFHNFTLVEGHRFCFL
jgi:hypothetical protein